MFSDTIATALYLINQLMFPPSEKKQIANSKFPRVCFIHQIYSILQDNTAVDREIQQSVKAGTWRKFHIVGTLDDEYAVMETKDYLLTIQEAKQEFIKDVTDGINKDGKDLDPGLFDRFQQLVHDGRYFDTTIARQALISPNTTSSSTEQFTEKELIQLCKYGLLLPHMKKDSYWFAIRRQGTFMSSFLKGRTEVLRMLKKRSTKDIMEKLFKTKKLRQTVFSHDFILHDLIGSGRVERHKTAMGDLIKLTKKGELGR
ncbi:serine-threonine protein kinase 19 [Halteromyces radiatus]|uniref:serine-threonine protein kinase 19 n=1 Tax=Halteromyces radiatus TaxID=101107 RepID=UPI00221E71AF|nr:serine-threonine protein kinase 19 [Halteromyces radiatus]KAI8097529.1 serine-threonine protein kinase 19 [Halteromyces radiatus]